MRTLVRTGTITETEQRVKAMEKEGWTAITPVKLDDSEITYNKVYYVCVMERPDKAEHSGKRKWGRGY